MSDGQPTGGQSTGGARRFLPATVGLNGTVRVPGDKSVSHRAALFGAVNNGPLRVSGFLRSADTLATLYAVRALGVQVDEDGDELVIHGAGWEGLKEPADVIDVRNSGTLIRLLPGLLASLPFLCVLTGDGSIRRRPMARVLRPLRAMGATVAGRENDSFPPIAIRGGSLRGMRHELAVASAQVKSCILLAGLRADGETGIVEPAVSRDHTERIIRYAGGRVEREGAADGPGVVRVWPVETLKMDSLAVPGDFSSAAFFIVAALLIDGSRVTVENAGLNPSRTGLLAVLERMGAAVDIETLPATGPESVGRITARTSHLVATDVGAQEVPNVIDELPLFLLAAAKAEGVSRLRGAAELRAKESDRLETMAALLGALGVKVEEFPDGMDVYGNPDGWSGGSVATEADHRVAMAGAIAGAVSTHGTTIDDAGCIGVSYPDFVQDLEGLGGAMIIAIDGPAGSGKSTIAREVAKRLGMHYLDTGAMYRTVALLALEAGLVPDRIPEAAELAAKSGLRFVERPDDLTRAFIGDREVTDEIRGREVSQAVSPVSADAAVRALMTVRQREEASRGDVVLEGRDIGTVVFPNAEAKVYLVASIEERARRRRAQLLAQGVDQPVDQIVSDISARDAYDSGRALAPLRKADDATEIDTTGMTIPEVIHAVSALVEARRPLAAASGGQAVEPAPGVAEPAPPAQRSASAPARSGKKWPLSRMVRGPLDTWLYRFAFSFIPPVWRLLFRMKIKGAENIPRSGAVLLVSNHRSNLDPFFVGVAFPRQIHFMAKAELWKVKALGRLIDLLGTFPVNRGEADRKAVKRALDTLAAGAVVGMFPEGHRQRSGQLGEIQAGVSLFALRDGVATVPMIVDGTERVVRKGLLRLTRVTVTFGPPLELPGSDVARSQRSQLVGERLNKAFRDLLASSTEAR